MATVNMEWFGRSEICKQFHMKFGRDKKSAILVQNATQTVNISHHSIGYPSTAGHGKVIYVGVAGC